MVPGPASRSARELPRNKPVPIAPPMAIMLSCPELNPRWSCSPLSMECTSADCSGPLVGMRPSPVNRKIQLAAVDDGAVFHNHIDALGVVDVVQRVGV